jgi:hypothetical protein
MELELCELGSLALEAPPSLGVNDGFRDDLFPLTESEAVAAVAGDDLAETDLGEMLLAALIRGELIEDIAVVVDDLVVMPLVRLELLAPVAGARPERLEEFDNTLFLLLTRCNGL